ncbi:MAG: phytanoyl-CoA dioxygenase family protein [bacterium]|nr:phytanoyl-CoA dioxygenase family protein [bacterium]
MAEPIQELRVSNDAMDDGQELRRRIAEEGYLFFRKLQDPDVLLDLRRQMLTVMQAGGWLVADTDPMDGIADVSRRCTEGDVGYTDVYHEVYKLEAFHRSAHRPEVMEMMEKVIGRPVLPHPHKVARLWFPQYTDHTTPIHQDFVHFQGNFETYTCWAPVGDCPIELGGLAVLPGSHKVNRVLEHHFSLGAGGLYVDTSDMESEWHSTDYEVGDTLIFLALTIHQALPNWTEDRLRVSLDNRYQAVGDLTAEHMLTPHLSNFSGLSWDEVYADWESEDLKYYWKDLELHTLPKDTSYSEKGFAEALERAREGDAHARYHLSRIVKRDPTTPQAKAAAEALQGVVV